jgi:4-hydroxybenzoate polyprenyltransferase
VVINDYFDYKVDAQNAPHKPLPSGAVAPDVALLLSSVIYCAVLIIACLMEPSALRSIIAFSAAATLLYTPVFKKLTAIKNATVATVIALAPVAGALAAGAVSGAFEAGV